MEQRVYSDEFTRRNEIITHLKRGRSMNEALRRAKIPQTATNLWFKLAKKGVPAYKKFADDCKAAREEAVNEKKRLVLEVIRLMSEEGMLISEAEQKLKIKKGHAHAYAEEYQMLGKFNEAKKLRKSAAFSDSEIDLFRYIVKFRDEKGYPPKMSDVADHFNVTKQAVSFMIRNPNRRRKWKNVRSAGGN